MKFIECDTCSKKPGMATLCPGCLNNRKAIEILRKKSYYENWQESKRQLDRILELIDAQG